MPTSERWCKRTETTRREPMIVELPVGLPPRVRTHESKDGRRFWLKSHTILEGCAAHCCVCCLLRCGGARYARTRRSRRISGIDRIEVLGQRRVGNVDPIVGAVRVDVGDKLVHVLIHDRRVLELRTYATDVGGIIGKCGRGRERGKKRSAVTCRKQHEKAHMSSANIRPVCHAKLCLDRILSGEVTN